MSKKIILLGVNIKEDFMQRLRNLGEVEFKESPSSVEDFLEKTKSANIIYSDGSFLLESLPKLKNVFVTYPYVELGVFNSLELEKNGVFVANSRGGNKNSIVEWTMYMILSLFRNFTPMVRATESFEFQLNESLNNKKTLIIGKGSIGSKVGELCQAFGMNVDYFSRGDDLKLKSKNVDLVVNSLNCNSSSKNLLSEDFFLSLKKGSYYVTFSRPYTYDIDGLINSINQGIVSGAGIDCDPENFGDTENDFYKKALKCPKILVTPHIAFSTNEAIENGGKIAIENIEAYLSNDLQNIVKKQ